MELFYSQEISGNFCSLDEQESRHCVKVLRHRVGEIVNVIDGEGSLMECRIVEASKRVTLEILSVTAGFGAHNYHLQMAVCPTKNIDRYEWFLEKATEIGIDSVVPVIGEHSERKVINAERCNRILLSAAKQSLKGAVPQLEECCSVKDYIKNQDSGLRLIAYCGDATKMSVPEAVEAYLNQIGHQAGEHSEVAGTTKDASLLILPQIKILIGPEGDFSAEEVALAIEKGFIPVHLGKSRLRTETAAVVACSWIYSLEQLKK